jgi:glycolate oxidase
VRHPADLVAMPASAQQIAAIARLCHEMRVPLVPRGAGTGYTGGAGPLHGGVVISLERLNRILEIDEENLLAVVEPAVITGDLQDAVEARGLFYPPDPQSFKESSLGGNIAECAGGPRAFKYGVTKRYVLGLEAVLPTGEIIRTGSKAVEERRRLRPHAAAGGLRGHAGDCHADYPCGWCPSRRPSRRCGRVFPTCPPLRARCRR